MEIDQEEFQEFVREYIQNHSDEGSPLPNEIQELLSPGTPFSLNWNESPLGRIGSSSIN